MAAVRISPPARGRPEGEGCDAQGAHASGGEDARTWDAHEQVFWTVGLDGMTSTPGVSMTGLSTMWDTRRVSKLSNSSANSGVNVFVRLGARRLVQLGASQLASDSGPPTEQLSVAVAPPPSAHTRNCVCPPSSGRRYL